MYLELLRVKYESESEGYFLSPVLVNSHKVKEVFCPDAPKMPAPGGAGSHEMDAFIDQLHEFENQPQHIIIEYEGVGDVVNVWAVPRELYTLLKTAKCLGRIARPDKDF